MIQLKELMADCLPDIEEHRERIQSQSTVEFVKESTVTESKAKVKKRGKKKKRKNASMEVEPASKKLKPELMQPCLSFNPNDFVLIERLSHGQCWCKLAWHIINQSGDFNGTKFDITNDVNGCTVSLNGQFIAKGNGKAEAGLKAIKQLYSTFWTIESKCLTDAKEGGISRNEVETGSSAPTAAEFAPLPTSNIGNKMMAKMGWTGGGLGQEGRTGIIEPVSVQTVVNRTGLGLSSNNKNAFLQKVEELLQQHVASSNKTDICFKGGFSKEDRAGIHKVARKLGLASQSYGAEEERYMVIRMVKNTKKALIHQLLEEGGETSKFLLRPPTSKDQPHAAGCEAASSANS
jgi:hypothetical protein